MFSMLRDIFRKQEKSKQTLEQKEALRKINEEQKSSKKRDKKGDAIRISKLRDIDKIFTRNKYERDVLDTMIKLATNLDDYIREGYENIKDDLASPNLLSIQGMELHIDPYAPLNHSYSRVDLQSGLTNILDRYTHYTSRCEHG